MLLMFISFFTAPLGAKTEDAGPDYEEIDNSIVIDRIGNSDLTVTFPSAVFSFKDAEIGIRFNNPLHTRLLANKNRIEFIINGEPVVLEFVNGSASFRHRFDSSQTLSIYTEDFSFSKSVTVYPLWAIIAPLVVILVYIFIRVLKK